MIDDNTRFEKTRDVVATEFEGGRDAVLLNLATKKYYTLNETAAAIWSGIEETLEVRALVELVTARYDVAPEKARSSVLQTLLHLQEQDLVRPCPET